MGYLVMYFWVPGLGRAPKNKVLGIREMCWAPKGAPAKVLGPKQTRFGGLVGEVQEEGLPLRQGKFEPGGEPAVPRKGRWANLFAAVALHLQQ